VHLYVHETFAGHGPFIAPYTADFEAWSQEIGDEILGGQFRSLPEGRRMADKHLLTAAGSTETIL